jgi:hypothetical protein
VSNANRVLIAAQHPVSSASQRGLARTIGRTHYRTILASGCDQFLLSIAPFDQAEQAEFADLLRHRLGDPVRIPLWRRGLPGRAEAAPAT